MEIVWSFLGGNGVVSLGSLSIVGVVSSVATLILKGWFDEKIDNRKRRTSDKREFSKEIIAICTFGDEYNWKVECDRENKRKMNLLANNMEAYDQKTAKNLRELLKQWQEMEILGKTIYKSKNNNNKKDLAIFETKVEELKEKSNELLRKAQSWLK